MTKSKGGAVDFWKMGANMYYVWRRLSYFAESRRRGKNGPENGRKNKAARPENRAARVRKRQRGKGRCDEGGKAAAEEMRETVSGLAGKGDFTRPPDGQREENAKTGGQNAGGD